jgi:acetolactate synthase I/II/III large subunit
VVDDSGYGILREYQKGASFGHFGVDLHQPDWPSLLGAYGIPVRRSAPERVEDDLRWALAEARPAAVVLPVQLAMPEATS